MPSVTPAVMRSFLGELGKEAGLLGSSASLGRGGVALGAGLTGAALGGLSTGQSGYVKARQEGQGRLDALGAGLKGSLKGMAIGGAAGGALGAVAPKSMGKTVRDFGGQTLHMWTGYGGKRGLARFGGGTAQTGERMMAARKAEQAAHEAISSGGRVSDPRLLAKWRSPKTNQELLEMAQKEHQAAQQGHAAMAKAQDMGLTSVPGVIKAYASSPIEAAKASWGAVAHGTSAGQKALMLGIPGGMAAYGAIRKPQEGESRLGNTLGSVGQALPGLMMPVMPSSIAMAFAPGAASVNPAMMAGTALEHTGKAVGGVVGRRKSTGQVQPPPVQGGAL